MKKVVSLLLVAALAVSMSTMSFAAVKKVDKAVPATKLLDQDFNTMHNDGYAAPGDSMSVEMPVDGTYFTMTEPTGSSSIGLLPTSTAGLTKAEMSSAKVTLKTRISKGSAAIDVIELDYVDTSIKSVGVSGTPKIATIKCELVDPFVSINTDGLEFAATAYLMVDGTSWLDAGVDFYGTLKNDFSDEVVDADYDYFNLSEGTIMKPKELVKSMEFALGEDVSVFGRALKGVKYYGVVVTDTTSDDDANILKYDLDGVYHLKTINLESVASYVTLGGADSTHYIYDGDMKYLGRGNDHLPYASTYYLSAKELDVDDSSTEEPSEEGEESTDDTEAPNPNSGADDSYPENVNDNPGTGR